MSAADKRDAILYVQKGPATLTEMSGQEVREALKHTRAILMPLGATEDHGPHLPLGTDSMEAREICRRTAVRLEELNCPVVVGPVIPFGTSSFHMAFPGTVSIRSGTLTRLLFEVCMSLYEGGFRDFILIHGHDGNLPSMMVSGPGNCRRARRYACSRPELAGSPERCLSYRSDVNRGRRSRWGRRNGPAPGYASGAGSSRVRTRPLCASRTNEKNPGARPREDRRCHLLWNEKLQGPYAVWAYWGSDDRNGGNRRKGLQRDR